MLVKHILFTFVEYIRKLHQKVYSKYLKVYFLHIGKHVVVAPYISYKNPLKIFISDECIIRNGVTLNGRSSSRIGLFLGTGVSIRESSYLDAYDGYIHIDDYCAIGHRCIIGGHGGLYIGKYTMIGGLTYIIPSNHAFKRADIPYVLQGSESRGIHIGSNVWIGASCVILDGVSIGDNCIIAAGSIVSQSIPANCVAMGVPARVKRAL